MPSTAPLWASWARGHANLPGPWAASEPLSVTYPRTQLVTRARIALGADFTADPLTWAWQDITQYLRYADGGVTITCGRRDEASTSDTKTAVLRLANPGGIFVRRNPTGPYYGLLSKNTPIWLTLDAGDGERTRFEGYVNEWPTRWDKSGNDTTVPIVCSGVLRRLAANRQAQSAARRTILGVDQPTPLAYYPCEGSTSALTLPSGLTGGPAIAGRPPSYATGITGSAGALDLTAYPAPYYYHITVPLLSANGFQIEACTLASESFVLMTVQAFTAGSSTQAVGLSPIADGAPHHQAWRFQPSGSDVVVLSYHDGVLFSTTTITTSALSSNLVLSFGVVQNAALTTTTNMMAHLAVYDSSTMILPTGRGLVAAGYASEPAHNRLSRLAGELGVPFTSLAGQSVAMGPQPTADAITVLRDAETVDQGFLYEGGFGLAYQSNDERTNAPVALTLDFDLGHIAEPPEPADDDQRTRNRWTSSLASSEATVEDAAAEAADGLYSDGAAVNVNTASQLADDAGWHVRLGSVDEDRWPSIALRFNRSPDLIPTWTTTALGARINIINPLPETAPDTIDAFLEGWSERWDGVRWEAVLNTSPASPYDVGKVAATTADTDPLLGWIDWDSCTLHADVDSTATSWQIDAVPVDTTNADDFPRPCRIGGEDIIVTACSGGSAPQTWTVTRSVNGVVKAHSAGDTIALSRPLVPTL